MQVEERGGKTGLLLLLVLAVCGAAARAGASEEELQRWVPAFSFYGGALGEDASGQVVSGPLLGPGAPMPPSCDPDTGVGCVRPGASGSDLLLDAFVEGSLQLMTPGLRAAPGHPRLFVHAGLGGAFGSTYDVAKEGSPGPFLIPSSRTPANVTANEIRGQGSKTSVEVQPLLVSAGLGVTFTLELGERRLRIKPSFEYLREEIDLHGVVNRVVAASPDGNCELPSPADTRFRCIELRGSDSKVYHGIGPGLEFELDAARAGPFLLAVFLGGQAYSFLGDLGMQAADTNEFGETAEWRAEKNRWGYRGGVGMRLHWLPE